MKNTTHLLFDLGNVLIELNGMPFLRSHYSTLSDAEIHRRWLTLESVQRFETGVWTREKFIANAPKEMGLDMPPDEFGTLFESWLIGPFHGAEAFIHRLRDNFHVGCLSNTNEIHIQKLQRESSLLSSFHDLFFSFQIGALKPTQDAFRHVLDAWGIDPQQIIFLDDNADNIRAAQQAGMVGYKTVGLKEAEAVCARLSTSGNRDKGRP